MLYGNIYIFDNTPQLVFARYYASYERKLK